MMGSVVTEEKQRVRSGSVVAVVAILLAAVNLRLAVTSVGPVLAEIRQGLGMSGTVAGLLTSLPVVCFALFGFAAPRLARRFGPAAVVAAGLVVLAVGLTIRPYAPSTPMFVLLSGVALAGIAVVNVLLPMIVKERFAERAGLLTGLYSLSLNLGAAAAAGATVPLTGALGDDWRLGLAAWAVVAVLAVPPWLMLARGHTPSTRADAASPAAPPLRVLREPVAWALAVYFGMQSTSAYVMIGWLPQIYRDAGLSPSTAGVLFAVTSFLGVPLGFLVTTYAGRVRTQSLIAVGLGVAGIAGYGGLWLDPAAAPWLWAILLGIANCAFPLVLTMITLRGRTPASVVRLSAFGQGVGYLIAIPGPILVGLLHDASGGWRVPLTLMVALTIPQIIGGAQAGRDRQV
jgi:MFS transporter, CP family, cyanate transporter